MLIRKKFKAETGANLAGIWSSRICSLNNIRSIELLISENVSSSLIELMIRRHTANNFKSKTEAKFSKLMKMISIPVITKHKAVTGLIKKGKLKTAINGEVL